MNKITKDVLSCVFCQVINEEVYFWCDRVIFSIFEDREKNKAMNYWKNNSNSSRKTEEKCKCETNWKREWESKKSRKGRRRVEVQRKNRIKTKKIVYKCVKSKL